MAYEAFSDAWAREWCRALNESQAYRTAAAGWEGALALVMEADPSHGVADARAVVVDLWHGGCRGGRAATAEDLAQAAYILSADPLTWTQVMSGEMEPVQALMRGRLRLTKGNLIALAPYARAAQELVAAAARVETALPGAPA